MKPLVFGALVGITGLVLAETSLKRGASNLEAFRAVIREGESDGDYTALTGGGNFKSFRDHPANTGEFAGIWTDSGKFSTAAGGYQIVRTTWNGLRAAGFDLPDFSPESQDSAAEILIARRGAVQAIESGDLQTAISLLADEWEMFKKPRWSYERVLNRFLHYGGVIHESDV